MLAKSLAAPSRLGGGLLLLLGVHVSFGLGLLFGSAMLVELDQQHVAILVGQVGDQAHPMSGDVVVLEGVDAHTRNAGAWIKVHVREGQVDALVHAIGNDLLKVDGEAIVFMKGDGIGIQKAFFDGLRFGLAVVRDWTDGLFLGSGGFRLILE